MKVSKCGGKETITAKQYSYKELKESAPEGVYTDNTHPNNKTRWIVIDCTFGDRALLLWRGDDSELTISEGAHGPFTLTNESVCFELRSP